MTNKIRSAWGPLIRDYEKRLKTGGLAGVELRFGFLAFGGNFPERVHT
jgi:hypothetical protein